MNHRRILAAFAITIMLATALLSLTAVSYSDDSDADPAGFSTYYYDQLSDDEKILYGKIGEQAATIDGPSEIINVESSWFPSGKAPGSDRLATIFYSYNYDHPDVFWLRSYSDVHVWSTEGKPISDFTLNYTVDSESARISEKNAIDNAVSNITVDGEFAYDKVKQIHDWIVGNVSYNKAAVTSKDPDAHNIYGPFAQKTCVCEGYAKAFFYLCQINGIETVVSIGDGVTSSGTEGHMWSYVKMDDGAWYCMDVTWDDPLVDGKDSGKIHYDYFLKGTDSVNDDRTFRESHVDTMKKDFGLDIPVLSEKQYRFQPGAAESQTVVIGPDSEGGLPASYTLPVSSIDGLREKAGTGGTIIIRVQNGEFLFTCEQLKTMKEKLTADSVASVEFSMAAEPKTVKGFGQYPELEPAESISSYSKEVTGYTPYISTGISGLGLEKVTIGLPFKMHSADISQLLFAWDISDADHPAMIKAGYSDGYETFEVSSLGTFCTGNNPVSPATDIPALVMIGAALAVFVLILLLIRRTVRRHGIKKRARKMARSNRNMEHYGELYENGELSSKEMKAYRMAVKIRKKKSGKD